MAKNNLIITKNDHAEIIIDSKKYGIKVVIIDADDIDKCKEYNWYASRCTKEKYGFYIRGRKVGSKSLIGLHRLIMNFPPLNVDHINHNSLDNRKCNLRLANSSENGQNKIKCQSNNKTSGIKNIHWNKEKSKWQVKITLNKITTHIGYYKDLEKAKEQAIKARKEYHLFSQETLNEDKI